MFLFIKPSEFFNLKNETLLMTNIQTESKKLLPKNQI